MLRLPVWEKHSLSNIMEEVETYMFARVTSRSNRPVFWALEAAGRSTSNFGSRITEPAWIKKVAIM